MKCKIPTAQKLPSGMWRCQVTVNGKRVSVIEENPGAAQAKALAIKAGVIAVEEKRKTKMTLREAIEDYVETKGATLSPSTIRGYNTIKRNRIQDLMEKNIYTITKKDVQLAINKEAQEVSAKTIANIYGLIRPVLKEHDINVFGIKLPQKIKPQKNYLQPEEISSFLLAAEGDPFEDAILLAVWLGLRRSEIMGLCWDSVDFKKNTITIQRTVVPDENNSFVLKNGAKNESSQRTIACPKYIMDKLKKRKPRAKPKDTRIFTCNPNTISKHVHTICQEAGVTDTTLHGLRHTNAAIMKNLGIDDLHAMERGGWTNETTYKKTYAYVFSSSAKEQDDKINQFFQEKIAHDTAHDH